MNCPCTELWTVLCQNVDVHSIPLNSDSLWVYLVYWVI